MASTSPPPAWSVAVCLRHRGGLEIQAAAENVLPGWGHGGERLSFLLRLRRRLRLDVTSQCGRALSPTEPKKPRACKILRFLRGRWAQLPRIPILWRRKKPAPAPRATVRGHRGTPTSASAAASKPGSRTQAIPSLLMNRALIRPSTTTVLCFVALLAVAAALRLMAGFMIQNASCISWRCFLAKKFVKFLAPPLYEWLLPKLSFKWF